MVLRNGSKGDLVESLQEALLELGFHPGPIDGHFGRLTEDAIEKFQKSEKMSVDGLCGPSTFGELNSNRKLILWKSMVGKSLDMNSNGTKRKIKNFLKLLSRHIMQKAM